MMVLMIVNHDEFTVIVTENLVSSNHQRRTVAIGNPILVMDKPDMNHKETLPAVVSLQIYGLCMQNILEIHHQ